MAADGSSRRGHCARSRRLPGAEPTPRLTTPLTAWRGGRKGSTARGVPSDGDGDGDAEEPAEKVCQKASADHNAEEETLRKGGNSHWASPAHMAPPGSCEGHCPHRRIISASVCNSIVTSAAGEMAGSNLSRVNSMLAEHPYVRAYDFPLVTGGYRADRARDDVRRSPPHGCGNQGKPSPFTQRSKKTMERSIARPKLMDRLWSSPSYSQSWDRRPASSISAWTSSDSS